MKEKGEAAEGCRNDEEREQQMKEGRNKAREIKKREKGIMKKEKGKGTK